MERKIIQLEERVSGTRGLETAIEQLIKTIDDLHVVVIELKTKDAIRSSIAGVIGGGVMQIIFWIIQHFKV